MKIPIHQLKKWIAALDSGEYKQGRRMLQVSKNKYCCIGVGCLVLIPKVKLCTNAYGDIIGGFAEAQPYAPDWFKEINKDFCKKTGRSLIELNDSLRYTFSEIATLLELVYVHKILD